MTNNMRDSFEAWYGGKPKRTPNGRFVSLTANQMSKAWEAAWKTALDSDKLRNAVVILPDGAEPKGGDIVINKAGWPKPISKIEDNVAYWAEHGKYHGCSIYDCKTEVCT